jgi:CelD/BcsL family acetyltransferase involved in cellulose biosynthesis
VTVPLARNAADLSPAGRLHAGTDSSLRVEWRPLAELGGIAAPWRDLAARALVPNVFYEPAFALPAAATLGSEVGAGLVWSRGQRLLGLFPGRIERRRYGVALPVLVGWTHAYAPLGAPLVDRDAVEAVVSAWLDHLRADGRMPRLVLLPRLPVDGDLARSIAAATADRGGCSIDLGRHARALLAPERDRTGYLDRALGGRKRKELRRQRRRLAEAGAVSTATARDPEAVARALETFFDLEAAGWKGRAGTAARCNAATLAFMASAVAALAAEGKAEVSLLLAAEVPAAAMVTLRSGNVAWCWKIAYDERRARSSPGVQLLVDVTQALLGDPALVHVDSCATAGHPMIDHVWRERLVLADRLLCVDAESVNAFRAARRLEALRSAAVGAARRSRELLRATVAAADETASARRRSAR